MDGGVTLKHSGMRLTRHLAVSLPVETTQTCRYYVDVSKLLPLLLLLQDALLLFASVRSAIQHPSAICSNSVEAVCMSLIKEDRACGVPMVLACVLCTESMASGGVLFFKTGTRSWRLVSSAHSLLQALM